MHKLPFCMHLSIIHLFHKMTLKFQDPKIHDHFALNLPIIFVFHSLLMQIHSLTFSHLHWISVFRCLFLTSHNSLWTYQFYSLYSDLFESIQNTFYLFFVVCILIFLHFFISSHPFASVVSDLSLTHFSSITFTCINTIIFSFALQNCIYSEKLSKVTCSRTIWSKPSSSVFLLCSLLSSFNPFSNSFFFVLSFFFLQHFHILCFYHFHVHCYFHLLAYWISAQHYSLVFHCWFSLFLRSNSIQCVHLYSIYHRFYPH